MEQIYRDYLLSKHIVVQSGSDEKSDATIARALFCLYHQYGIVIRRGEEHLNTETCKKFVEEYDFRGVPESFYKNYPMSVLRMTPDDLLLDQIIHYTITYGLGKFDESGHSLFEQKLVERKPLSEDDVVISEWEIVTEEEAYTKIGEIVTNFMAGTRPLSLVQEHLVLHVYSDTYFDNSVIFKKIRSKNVAMNLLVKTRDMLFTKHLTLSDFPKIVEELLYSCYYSGGFYEKKPSIKKLNLKNKDRVFLTKILDTMFTDCDIKNQIKLCMEKKKIWCGILHHIHYKAKNIPSETFIRNIRGDINYSYNSEIEKNIQSGYLVKAAQEMINTKGTGYLLRNLNYLLSRCSSNKEVVEILNNLDGKFNIIPLIQLILKYQEEDSKKPRNFTFIKNKLQKHHKETEDEFKSRKSFVSEDVRDTVMNKLMEIFNSSIHDKIKGKVFVDEDMKKLALPINESTGSSGIGVLTTGSRVPLGDRKLRAFTYWEKVYDIDLACFGIDADGNKKEFSWRTMFNNQSDSITFSGDETSGFDGGSEFFDIDLEKLKSKYPDLTYIIFTNNVFSDSTFDKCFCKAGFMLRKDLEAGKVFEPKTVKTSYTINSTTSFAYLFAIDVEKNEMVWLNIANDSRSRIAGNSEFDWLRKYFNITDKFNVYDFFTTAAEEVVNTVEEADTVVSDKVFNDNVIHSWDIDKITAYINM